MSQAHAVLLHGWGLSSFATRYWCRRLQMAGFATSQFAYRSRAQSLVHNTAALAAHVRALPRGVPVHLVGHSLGGIVIIQCLATQALPQVKRAVMVGTPFQGSAPAQRLMGTAWGRVLLGKTILQWHGVQAKDVPKGLQIGTIAGTRPIGMGRVLGKLQSPHDGTVSLAETEVPFATDRLVMHITHSEMLVSPQVSEHIVHFLRHGGFKAP